MSSLQNYRQPFSRRGVQQKQDGGKRRPRGCIERDCIWGLSGQIYWKMGRSYAIELCSVILTHVISCHSCIFLSFNVHKALIHLIPNFVLQPGEKPDDSRARLYKRLWCLLWISWNIVRHTFHRQIFNNNKLQNFIHTIMLFSIFFTSCN